MNDRISGAVTLVSTERTWCSLNDEILLHLLVFLCALKMDQEKFDFTKRFSLRNAWKRAWNIWSYRKKFLRTEEQGTVFYFSQDVSKIDPEATIHFFNLWPRLKIFENLFIRNFWRQIWIQYPKFGLTTNFHIPRVCYFDLMVTWIWEFKRDVN